MAGKGIISNVGTLKDLHRSRLGRLIGGTETQRNLLLGNKGLVPGPKGLKQGGTGRGFTRILNRQGQAERLKKKIGALVTFGGGERGGD